MKTRCPHHWCHREPRRVHVDKFHFPDLSSLNEQLSSLKFPLLQIFLKYTCGAQIKHGSHLKNTSTSTFVYTGLMGEELHSPKFRLTQTYHPSDVVVINQTVLSCEWLGGQSLPVWSICLRAFPLRSLLALTHLIKTREGEEAPLQSFSHVAKGQVHFPHSKLSAVSTLRTAWALLCIRFY